MVYSIASDQSETTGFFIGFVRVILDASGNIPTSARVRDIELFQDVQSLREFLLPRGF
jgi:hypothetical protein